MTNANPWEGMDEQSKRRAVVEKNHDLFWITDLEGRYGFIFYTIKPFSDLESPANLKGINILKRNSDANVGELILVLNDNQEWEIFSTLCKDLIVVALKHHDSDAMINSVEDRLKRWQKLLKQNSSFDMSIEEQMGLFSELLCLQNVLCSHFGIDQAVVSWVGADGDKQDYLLEKIAIEVKSYRTSKGKTISISSLEQLDVDQKHLFLICYGLTITENGNSIEDLVSAILTKLEKSKNALSELFETKLIQYGYVPEINKTPYAKFSVDSQHQFRVNDDFPKILRQQVSPSITQVNYCVDLRQCVAFEVDIDAILSQATA